MNEGPKRKERKRGSNKAKEKKELCLLLILIYLILLSLCPLTVSLCSSCSSLFSLIFQFSHSGDPQPRFHPVNSGEDENTHTRAHVHACTQAQKALQEEGNCFHCDGKGRQRTSVTLD